MKTELLETVSLPNQSIRLMCGALEDLRRDPTPLLDRSGVSERDVLAPHGQVLGAQELGFQIAFADATRDQPQAWFRLGQSYRARNFPLLGPAMVTAQTVAEGLDTVATFQALTYDLLQYRPYGRNGRVLGFEAAHDDVPPGLEAFVWLRGVAAATSIIRGDMCPSLKFVRIDFPLPKEEVPVDIEAELGVPVRYGTSVLRWVLPPDGADVEPPGACASAATSFRQRCAAYLGQVHEDLLAEKLTIWLLRSLAQAPSAGDAAAFLGISRRTLYRQLERAQVTYGDLLDRVRRDRARFLLRHSELPIETIALKLGFSETASFSRAFRRWHGYSPTAFRLRCA